MVYAPQRRHAVASLTSTVHALGLLQHLYTPNTMVLVGRILSQIQVVAPAVIQPTRSLLALFFMVTLVNIMSVLFHLLDFAGGTNGSKGLLLDFIGQAHPASLTRILLLDLTIYILQLTSLTVSYINNYASTLPKTSLLPGEDLLLPPELDIPDLPAPPDTDAEDDEIDVESGERVRKRRFGRGPRYEQVSSDLPETWLDDEEAPVTSPARPVSAGTTIRHRRSDSPLIFSLSLVYLTRLFFCLPPPSIAHVVAGGTPVTSPPVISRNLTSTQPLSLTAALAQARVNAESSPDTDAGRLTRAIARGTVRPPRGYGQGPSRAAEAAAAEGTAEGAAGEENNESGRIPGDYWTSGSGPR